MKATKTEEVRARVEPVLKLALDRQASAEFLQAPDIVRKALRVYLVPRQKALFDPEPRLVEESLDVKGC